MNETLLNSSSVASSVGTSKMLSYRYLLGGRVELPAARQFRKLASDNSFPGVQELERKAWSLLEEPLQEHIPASFAAASSKPAATKQLTQPQTTSAVKVCAHPALLPSCAVF